MRTSFTQRGQSESVSRGQPSCGNVRSRRFSSGAGAHAGFGEGRSKRSLNRWTSGHAARAARAASRVALRTATLDSSQCAWKRDPY